VTAPRAALAALMALLRKHHEAAQIAAKVGGWHYLNTPLGVETIAALAPDAEGRVRCPSCGGPAVETSPVEGQPRPKRPYEAVVAAAFGPIEDDTASPTQRQMDEHDSAQRRHAMDGVGRAALAADRTLREFWNGDVKVTEQEGRWIRQALDVQFPVPSPVAPAPGLWFRALNKAAVIAPAAGEVAVPPRAPSEPGICAHLFDSTVCVSERGHDGPHTTSNERFPHGLAIGGAVPPGAGPWPTVEQFGLLADEYLATLRWPDTEQDKAVGYGVETHLRYFASVWLPTRLAARPAGDDKEPR
jgi:hypothetical protein